MAFDSGSVTFKRFFVVGEAYPRVDEEMLERVRARAIDVDSTQTADYTQIGWTTGDHIFDSGFDFAKNALADGLHFALRVDTNKPPTDLVRGYQKINEQTMLEASGREFLTKAERREARDQALSRADAESRSGAFKRMKQVPVFFDLKRNEVYLGTTSTTVVESFMMLFRETFDRLLVPATSGELASRWSARASENRSFEDCRPAHFIQPPDGVADGDEPTEGDESRSRDFLGTEWLLWLWYTTQVESPEIVTQLGQAVTVLFEKSLQLQCPFQITGEIGIKAEDPTRLSEAGVALATGKRPIKVGLQIASAGDAYSLSLRGDVMHFSSVQLAPPEDASSAQAVFEDRIDKLRDMISAVDTLYEAFLRRRLSTKWQQTLSAMRTWITGSRSEPKRIPEPVAS
jgi:hypothetical protein